MKREFGKKLVEEYLPHWDITHVIDTAWAYIPGHGTPTVIFVGRHQSPIAPTIRTVMGIKGEPATPVDPAQGLVWRAIVDQVDHPGTQSEFISTADSPREGFSKHPWSIGGGGASELKELLDERCEKTLVDFVEIRRKKPVIGFGAVIGEEEAFTFPRANPRALLVQPQFRRRVIEGDQVRDWSLTWPTEAIFPYDSQIVLSSDRCIWRALWALRTLLANRPDFSGATYAEAGRCFWEYHQIPIERNQSPLLLVFAAVATHNHFALNRGGKVFKQSAPIIKLRANTEDAHLELLGLLNSSLACFWMKQVYYPKGGDHVGQEGARVRKTLWDERYDLDGTNLAAFPVTSSCPLIRGAELDLRLPRFDGHR